MYLTIEACHLKYIKEHQENLHADLYNGLMDALASDPNVQADQVGKWHILPSSFTGSPHHMHEQYRDAMAIVAEYGKPDLFLTFTCNPTWDEIKANLGFHQTPGDRPDLIFHAFYLKLLALLGDILKAHVLGKVRAYSWVVEFQKRGLPHVHMLLVLEQEYKL
jgi:hypothetical protein